jgi:diguanylate cyclase (GGDEF)-like protein
MVDPLTGVGTVHALRRDLMLQQAWPGAGRRPPVVVALDVDALDQVREAMGPEAGNHVLKSLADVAPFALRAQDRVYRSGRNQLTLLLPATDEAGAESARKGLEAALRRTLAGRGYPEIRLSARRVDAVALAS